MNGLVVLPSFLDQIVNAARKHQVIEDDCSDKEKTTTTPPVSDDNNNVQKTTTTPEKAPPTTTKDENTVENLDKEMVQKCLKKLNKIDEHMLPSLSEFVNSHMQGALDELFQEGGEMEKYMKGLRNQILEDVRSMMKEEIHDAIDKFAREEIVDVVRNVMKEECNTAHTKRASTPPPEKKQNLEEINKAWSTFSECMKTCDTEKTWRKNLRILFNDNGKKLFSIVAYCPLCAKEMKTGVGFFWHVTNIHKSSMNICRLYKEGRHQYQPFLCL